MKINHSIQKVSTIIPGMRFVQVIAVSIIIVVTLSLLYFQLVFLKVRDTARGIYQLLCLMVYKSVPLA